MVGYSTRIIAGLTEKCVPFPIRCKDKCMSRAEFSAGEKNLPVGIRIPEFASKLSVSN